MRRSAERAASFWRGFASLLALLVVAVAVPVGLVAVSRARFGSTHPFGGIAPPSRWNVTRMVDALRRPLSDDAIADIVIRACLIAVWVGVALVVASTIADAVHQVRHGGLPAPRVRGLGWAQAPARHLAAGILALLPLLSVGGAVQAGRTSLAELLVRDPPVATAHHAGAMTGPAAAEPGPSRPRQADHVDADDPEARPSPAATYVVRRGDSIWSIAADLAGGDDGATMDLAERLLDLNLGRAMTAGQRFTTPALIHPGWVLQLPHDLPTRPPAPDGTTAHDTTPDGAAPDDQRAPATTVDVRPGDTLSGIAAAHLGDAAAWPRLWEVNRGREMDDGRRFTDPDLIVPGWDLHLPEQLDLDPGADEAAPDDAALDDAALDDAALDDAAPDDAALDDAAPQAGTHGELAPGPTPDAQTAAPTLASPTTIATPPAVTPTTAAPATATPAEVPTSATTPTGATTSAATTSPTSTTPTPDPPGGSSRPTNGPTSAPTPLGLEHAGMLAAGVLALVTARRRRRMRAARPRSRVPAPRPELADVERRLRMIDPGERAARLDVALRAAAGPIADADGAVAWATVDDDGAIELRLTTPGELPAPWSGGDRTWTLPASVPVELVAADARGVGNPCVAMVQLGTTLDGRTVHVDPEAAGAMSIVAPSTPADQVLRAAAVSLAASPAAEIAHLVTCSLPSDDLLGHPNVNDVDDVDSALDLIVDLVGSTITAEASTFALRSRRTGGEMWEPAVLLLTSADDTTRLRDAIEPGRGVAAIAVDSAGALTHAPLQLIGDDDGWRLVGFGASLTLHPIGLDAEDVAVIAELVREAGTPVGPDEPEPSGAGTSISLPEPPAIVVRLLGDVDVIDANGAAASFERSKTLELVAWLATHRERSTRTGARTALWDLDVRDATFANVVSEARRGLGRLVPPPDGEEWVARTLTEQLPLHEGVRTDADLVAARLDTARIAAPAEAIEVLRPAVELVRGMPFAGTNYLWPDADGITTNLVLLATTACAELAGHALATGDAELVFWATGRGLQVLPGHEELVGLRMRAHAQAGDLAAVRQEWESYERVITADAWSDGEPAPKLVALRHELLASPGA